MNLIPISRLAALVTLLPSQTVNSARNKNRYRHGLQGLSQPSALPMACIPTNEYLVQARRLIWLLPNQGLENYFPKVSSTTLFMPGIEPAVASGGFVLDTAVSAILLLHSRQSKLH